MITDKHLTGLAVVALGLLIATVAVYSSAPGTKNDFRRDMLLVQGLDLSAIGQIEVTQGEESLRLTRKGDAFVVESLGDYPADIEKVNALQIMLLDVRCAKRLGAGDDSQKHFAVTEASAQATARILDHEGKLLVGLVIGKTSGAGTAVRRMDADVVYESARALSLSAKPMAYINTTLIDVPVSAVRQISIHPAGDAAYQIKFVPPVRQPGQQPMGAPLPRLTSLAEDEIADQKKVSTLAATARAVRFQALKDANTAGAVAWKGEVTVEQGPVAFVLRVGVIESQWVATVRLKGPVGQAPIDEYNALHAPWLYVLDPAIAQTLIAPRSTLLQDPNNPSEIAARHILISYKGASRSQVDRTKEEARARAEEVLAKAQAEDADFAALAKEYSDGPSGPGGGDLGVFGKGQMHPAFEAAAFGLQPSAVSEIVETPFGFHVIQRTK